MPVCALALVSPVHTFRVLLNGWKIRLDSKLIYIIYSYYFISCNALFCNTLNVHFLCSYYLSLFCVFNDIIVLYGISTPYLSFILYLISCLF